MTQPPAVQTLKFKLYRHHRNRALHQQIDIAGIIWNHCLALQRRYYRLTKKHINQFDLMKHLAKVKKLDKYSFWKMVGSQAIQDVVERVARAYKLFFNNLKRGIKTSPPTFKKVKKYKSFTLKQAGWKLLGGNKIRIQGKLYKFSKSREIDGIVKTVTVKRDNRGSLWLCFVVKKVMEVPNRTGHIAVGFDFGLKTFLTASDGCTYDNPQFLKQALTALQKASKALSRKVKYSKGWYRAKRKVASIHRSVVNRRRDWFFKLAHTLTDIYDHLFFEDLNMKGMQVLWGRKTGDLARSEFMAILEWVAWQKGNSVGYVARFYPSSKTCSICGNINKALQLSDRVWHCPHCHTQLDRDLNASVNICTEGIRCCGLGDVRPALLANSV